MSKEEIESGNTIIADFMGLHRGERTGIWFGELPENKTDEPIETKDLEYKSNWNWLMPTWYKFRDLRFDKEKLEVEHSEWKNKIAHKICWGQTTDAFIEIVEALKWLNLQTK